MKGASLQDYRQNARINTGGISSYLISWRYFSRLIAKHDHTLEPEKI